MSQPADIAALSLPAELAAFAQSRLCQWMGAAELSWPYEGSEVYRIRDEHGTAHIARRSLPTFIWTSGSSSPPATASIAEGADRETAGEPPRGAAVYRRRPQSKGFTILGLARSGIADQASDDAGPAHVRHRARRTSG
jgi:hypothetical protein